MLNSSLFSLKLFIDYLFQRLNRAKYSPLSQVCVMNLNQLEELLVIFFWTCPKLTSFWANIFHLHSNVYDKQLAPDCPLVILGCSCDFLDFSQHISASSHVWYVHCQIRYFEKMEIRVPSVSIFQNG